MQLKRGVHLRRGRRRERLRAQALGERGERGERLRLCARLSRADLSRADLSRADLSRADLSRADISRKERRALTAAEGGARRPRL
ncbi:MAG: pentapeptide repeat-containing protein [Deltaproteobacteria bacterium]|nr:pentapeptide repeat-containing protein [Deltaproteobacteria bacterium]